MKRLTIRVADDLAAALHVESRRQRKSVSEIAREAISIRVRQWPIVDGKRVIPFAGIGRSEGDGNISANIDEIIAKEWTLENPLDHHP